MYSKVLGGPGVGKGTQCANIVRDFGWVHLSAGDLLRAERSSGSANAILIQDVMHFSFHFTKFRHFYFQYISKGRIVPVDITVGLIKTAMEQNATKNFIVDGFPRNNDNQVFFRNFFFSFFVLQEGWDRVIGDGADVLLCLNFECSDEV